MGRLIKYELKKQQTSRNIILALLLVFLLAFAVGIFSDNGNMVGISVGLEIFVGMFVFFYMGIESFLNLKPGSEDKAEPYAMDGAHAKLEDPWGKIYRSSVADFLHFSSICAGWYRMRHDDDRKRKAEHGKNYAGNPYGI